MDTTITEDKYVEIFDDDNREEEERQYLQDIDYDSVVISQKIKDKKKLLKQKFDDLKKQSAPLYSYESCKELFDRIDKKENLGTIGIIQKTEVALYLKQLKQKTKDKYDKYDEIDEMFIERFKLNHDQLQETESDKMLNILAEITSEFPQLEFNKEDSSNAGMGIRGANLLEFIEFMNNNKKNHSKEILLLNEIIDIALEKIKYEIVDCRLKGIKGTILILKANISILNFFKIILYELQSGVDIDGIISKFEKYFQKEITSSSKSKNYLEYQDVRFDHDAIETLYHKDKYVLVKILKKQAQELLYTISYLENIDKQEYKLSEDVDMNKFSTDISNIIRKLEINSINHAPKEGAEEGAEQLTMEEEGTKGTDVEDGAAMEEEGTKGTDVEDGAAMEEEGTDVEDEELVMQKILGILQYFIYTECIDVIKPSLADSIIALKLSSIKKDIELSSIKKDIELSKSKQCPSIEKSPKLLRSQSLTPSLTPSSPETQPPPSPQSLTQSLTPSPAPAGNGGGRKKKSKKKNSLEFKF